MGANFLALRDLGGVDVTGSVDARPELLPMLLVWVSFVKGKKKKKGKRRAAGG